ncbi:MAG: hypothetical protein ACUVRD_00860 [Bacteroidia bacterium]
MERVDLPVSNQPDSSGTWVTYQDGDIIGKTFSQAQNMPRKVIFMYGANINDNTGATVHFVFSPALVRQLDVWDEPELRETRWKETTPSKFEAAKTKNDLKNLYETSPPFNEEVSGTQDKAAFLSAERCLVFMWNNRERYGAVRVKSLNDANLTAVLHVKISK